VDTESICAPFNLKRGLTGQARYNQTGLNGVMTECNSKIELSPAYTERLTDEEIADMMAEAARVDALFKSGAIGTTHIVALVCAADVSREWQPEMPEASAA